MCPEILGVLIRREILTSRIESTSLHGTVYTYILMFYV